MNLDILPDEILVLILERVSIHPYYLVGSYLNNIKSCLKCERSNVKCIHIDTQELYHIKRLAFVCKRWLNIIKGYKYYKYKTYIP